MREVYSRCRLGLYEMLGYVEASVYFEKGVVLNIPSKILGDLSGSKISVSALASARSAAQGTFHNCLLESWATSRCVRDEA